MNRQRNQLYFFDNAVLAVQRDWETRKLPLVSRCCRPGRVTETLKKVSTEMSLHVLAYNLKRVIKILGTGALMEAMRA